MTEAGKEYDQLMVDLCKSGDIDVILGKVKESMDSWRTIPLNIAITGSSGSGKSSLINAMRGITNDHELASPVGVEETTMECKPFKYPNNDNCVVWDLPGVGTLNFPKENYLNAISFGRYDFFLICSSVRFSENDIWLAKEIMKRGKHFYLLRTKIDIDLANEKRDKPRTFDEKHTLQKIKDKYRQSLEKDYKLFLISSIYPEKWQFTDLEQALVGDIDTKKREALVLSLKTHSRAAIELKKEILQGRIQLVTLASALGGAIPIPGLSVLIDATLMKREMDFYTEQLGLTKASLEQRARDIDIPLHKILMDLGLKAEAITKSFVLTAATAAATKIGKPAIILPILGSIIGAVRSFSVTQFTLRKFLNEKCDEAIRVLEYTGTALVSKL